MEGRGEGRGPQVIEGIEIRHEPGGEDVNPGGGGGVGQRDAYIAGIGARQCGDMDWGGVEPLEGAVRGHPQAVALFALGDDDADDLVAPLQRELVAAGGQGRQFQESAAEPDRLAVVGDVRSGSDLKQREVFARGGICRPGVGDAYRDARDPMDRGGVTIPVRARRPTAGRTALQYRLYRRHVRQRSQQDLSLAVRSQADPDGIAEIPLLNLAVHHPVRFGFPISAQHLDPVIAAAHRQVQIVGVQGRAGSIDGKRRRVGHVVLVAAADILNLGAQGEIQSGQIVGNPKGIGRLPGIRELEILDLRPGGDPVLIDRLHGQSDILQQIHRDGPAVKGECRADQDLSLLVFQQGLAVYVDGGRERVGFRAVQKAGQGAEVAVPKDGGSVAGGGAIGDNDDAVFAGAVFPSVHPERSARPRAAVLIEHREFVPRGARLFDCAQLALAYHRPAADPVADELDHIESWVLALREIQGPANPADGGLREPQRLFVRRQEPVQVDGGIEFPHGALVIVEGIDLEYLHQQGFHVLDVEIKRDRRLRAELLGIVEGELQIDPVLEFLIPCRRQHGGPLLRVAEPIDDLGFHEDVAQIVVADHAREGSVIRIVDQEVGQVIADQFFVLADRRQPGKGGIVLAQVHQQPPPSGVGDIVRRHVRGDSRVLQVTNKPIAIVQSFAPVQIQ